MCDSSFHMITIKAAWSLITCFAFIGIRRIGWLTPNGGNIHKTVLQSVKRWK